MFYQIDRFYDSALIPSFTIIGLFKCIEAYGHFIYGEYVIRYFIASKMLLIFITLHAIHKLSAILISLYTLH